MFSVHVGPTTNFCFRARSGFAGKPNVKRERELIWHPHICQKWKGGHVGDRPDVGNLAGARKLELTENEQFSISKLADPVSQKCP